MTKELKKKMISNNFSMRHLINMANGVLGLSILTMPYCFEQCGLILGAVALGLSALMTSYSCKLLLKTIETKRTKTFEFLAWKLFGYNGKVALEICIILLLFGSLVTYQQTLSDSGPLFLSKLFNIQQSKISRSLFLVVFTVLVTLPLSLSKKLDTTNHINAFALVFYVTFGVYLLWESLFMMNDGWYYKINYWKFDGLLKCFPIFSISFSCQTVLFVVYDELPDASKEHAAELIDKSIGLAYLVYLMGGFFGYIAFYNTEIHGNIVTNIHESFMSLVLSFGFVVCVIAGFPFMVFPCRTSLNTLFFSSDHADVLESDLFIPEHRFKYITYFIVIMSAIIAIFIPNMEFVLSLTGSTTASLTCYVWPSIIYIYACSKNDNLKDLFVKIFFVIGLFIFFICTFVALQKFQPTKESNQIEIIKFDKEITKEIFSVPALKNDPKLDDVIRLEPPNPNENVQEVVDNLDKNADSNILRALNNNQQKEIEDSPRKTDSKTIQVRKRSMIDKRDKAEESFLETINSTSANLISKLTKTLVQ